MYIKNDARIKAAFKKLPVLVKGITLMQNGNRYRMCTKHGYLKGAYARNDLVTRKVHTA
jgi:hypothetical protein